MLFNVNNANRIVFVFVLLGVAFLGVFISIILINNKTFVDKVYYRTVVDNARGLGAKPPIYFKGIEIGRVTDFSLNEKNNEVEANFYVYSDFQSKIVRYAILADNKSILINNATEFELLVPNTEQNQGYSEHLVAGSLVPFISSRQAKDYIKQNKVTVPANSVDSIVTSVNDLLLNLQRSDNPEAGSLFKLLDRAAKMSDNLLLLSESLAKTSLISDAELLVDNTNSVVKGLPESKAKMDELLLRSSKLVAQLEQLTKQYKDPIAIMDKATQGKLPEILDNLNQSLVVVKDLVNEVHSERMQIMVTMDTVLKVLNKMDKTLQGVNNNPLLKGGIESMPQPKGIEMND